jgi:guanine nucleotide-binding protein subunit beta-2-like 1 protein
MVTMVSAHKSLSLLMGTMCGHNGEVTTIATPINNSPFSVSSRNKYVVIWDSGT